MFGGLKPGIPLSILNYFKEFVVLKRYHVLEMLQLYTNFIQILNLLSI